MHFAKPSWRRALWSIVIAFVLSSIVAGIAVAIGFIAGKDPNASVPAGEYIARRSHKSKVDTALSRVLEEEATVLRRLKDA